MHLAVAGKNRPDHTLAVIGAVYEGAATRQEVAIAEEVRDTFVGIVRDYYAGRNCDITDPHEVP